MMDRDVELHIAALYILDPRFSGLRLPWAELRELAALLPREEALALAPRNTDDLLAKARRYREANSAGIASALWSGAL